MAASELLCRAHSSSAQRSRPPVTSPRRLHPARGGRHHPWVTATAPVPAAAVAVRFLPAARPDPRRATPPTHAQTMGTHLGIADPPAPCRRRRRPCRPRFHPLALLPTPSGRQQKHADRTLRTSPSCSRQAWLAACWGVVFVCVVYSLPQCIVSEQRTIEQLKKPRSPGSPPPTVLYFAATAARALYPRAILVEPNLCSCFGSNLLQLSERDAASA